MKCNCGNTRFRTVSKADGVFKCRVCGTRYQHGVAISGREPEPPQPLPIDGRREYVRKAKPVPLAAPIVPRKREPSPVPEVKVHGLPVTAVPAPKSFLGTLASGIVSRVSRLFGGG